MSQIFRLHNSKSRFVVSLLVLSVFALSAAGVRAQSVARPNFGGGHSFLRDTRETGKKTTGTRPGENPPVNKKPETTEEKLSALEQMLERQNERLDQLQQTIAEQQDRKSVV